MKLVKTIAGVLLLFAVIAVLVLNKFVAPRLDASLNVVLEHEPWSVSREAAELHETLRVADLHADMLLWARDPKKRHDYGHTDFPRLREGGVFLQVFTAVTKSPSGLNYDHNDADARDDITLLAMAQLWPPRTWNSIYARADYQARRLEKLARADDAFYMVRTRADLEEAIAARHENPDVLAGVMGMEGAHPLEGDIANLDRLFAAGHRLIGLQHFFDNELGGSLHGANCEGLTPFGKEVVTRADELSMIIDVAHSCEGVVRDVLALTKRPVIISHTGIRSRCETPRNISDDLLAEIARRGGLIGIGYWDGAVCDATPDGIAAMIAYGVETFGLEAMALGSDFDGTVTTHFDSAELAVLTDALMRAGLSDTDIRKVMGENQIRFFLEELPQEE